MLAYESLTLRNEDRDAEPPLAVSLGLFALSGVLLALLGSGALG